MPTLKNNGLSAGDAAPDVVLSDDANHPTRLSDLWKEKPIALVFVRHSGCTFCLGHAFSLREAYPKLQEAGGDVVLVSMDDPAHLHELKLRQQLPFVCLSDSDQQAYRAYQCPRGGIWNVIGPHVWWRGLMSVFRHGLGKPRGDVMQLPSSFVIDRGGIVRLADRSANSAEWTAPDRLAESLRQVAHAPA